MIMINIIIVINITNINFPQFSGHGSFVWT